jgi:RHS repeat-associated protein
LLTAQDGNNRTRKFVYDKLNRPKEEQWLNSANTPIRTITSSYDAAGQLKTISDPDATYTLTYDLAGNLETVDNAGTPNVPNVLLKYTYNQVNRPISVTDTINGQLRGTKSFTYDDANRVTRITQSGNGVSSKRVDMSYDAAGKTKDVTRYSDLNGTGLVAKSEYVYDSVGRLTRLSHGKGNVALANYAWTYDFANRVTGFTSPDGSTTYSYDKRDQLTGADYSSQSDESYSYDDNGGRTNSGYQTGNNNQLKSDGVYNYEYDGEGNLRKRTDIVTGEVTEYSWDYRNRLTQVVGKNGSGSVIKSAQYSYDGLNRRIVREVDADGAGSGMPQVERLVYDGQQIALTFDGGGNQTHRYLYGMETDQILADESAGGSVLWPLTDNLGTVRDLVDSNGVIQNRIGYDSFGKVRSQTNSSVGFRLGFTGRELDSETGNYYYNSRYYDPQVGRFISEDTIGFGGGDVNLYRYVGNSPTNYTDPSGELIPTPIPVAAPPALGPLQRVPGLGWLLIAPGGGGLLNPFPAGQDDRLFQERVRRGLIRPQGTQTTPVLNRPKARPSPAPSPSTSPASPPLPNPDCKTCATDPELKKYVKYETIFSGTGGGKGGILVGYRYESKQAVEEEFIKSRRRQGSSLWWQARPVFESGQIPRVSVRCKYPPSQTNPEQGALHYNVTGDIFNEAGSTSLGSLGRCESCEDTIAGPKKRVTFAILNIKNFQGEPISKYDQR